MKDLQKVQDDIDNSCLYGKFKHEYNHDEIWEIAVLLATTLKEKIKSKCDLEVENFCLKCRNEYLLSRGIVDRILNTNKKNEE